MVAGQAVTSRAEYRQRRASLRRKSVPFATPSRTSSENMTVGPRGSFTADDKDKEKEVADQWRIRKF